MYQTCIRVTYVIKSNSKIEDFKPTSWFSVVAKIKIEYIIPISWLSDIAKSRMEDIKPVSGYLLCNEQKLKR
jgi:hypothetical protein